MENSLNLQPTEVAAIEALSGDQLREIRANLQDRDISDEETREAIAEYVADGGQVADLLPLESAESRPGVVVPRVVAGLVDALKQISRAQQPENETRLRMKFEQLRAIAGLALTNYMQARDERKGK